MRRRRPEVESREPNKTGPRCSLADSPEAFMDIPQEVMKSKRIRPKLRSAA